MGNLKWWAGLLLQIVLCILGGLLLAFPIIKVIGG